MADEKTTTEQPVAEPTVVSPFGSAAWSDTPTDVLKTVVQETPPAEIKTEVKKEEEEILEPKEWLKREFQVDDIEVLKAERAEFKKLKETPPTTEYKFDNEESRNMAEAISKGDRKAILKILQTQDRLETLTTAEVNDDTAADIIKLGMQLKYKDLSPDEIEYKYNKEFGIPRKPTERDDLTEDENIARVAEWEEKVKDIKIGRNIEAKLAKPELEKLKSTITFPETSKPPSQANEPTKEQLDDLVKIRENFLQALESNYSKVEGFTTKVKDESVEIPISFKIPDEDKVAIKGRLDEGVDVSEFMGKRWFDDKGNAKVDQIITDIFQLENLDKILSGVANKSASQRLIEYRKQVNNININGNGYQETFNNQNSGNNVSPFSKDAWSDKPPLINN
mgnify:FL=1